MDFSKNHIAIFFIDKNKGIFFTSSEPKGIEIDFPKDILSHLEIIDKSKLEDFIHKFLEKNNIKPSRLFIVLGADTTFEKDITGISSFELNSETQKFLDIIPFEETLSKTFKVQKEGKIYVANKSLCKELSEVFEKERFSIAAITPFSLLLEINPKLKQNLPFLLKKLGTIKQYSLLSSNNQSNQPFNAGSSLNTMVIILILISIFLVLIIVLTVLLFTKFLVS